MAILENMGWFCKNGFLKPWRSTDTGAQGQGKNVSAENTTLTVLWDGVSGGNMEGGSRGDRGVGTR